MDKGDTVARQVWIGTSWKMNKTLAQALAFAEVIAREAAALDPAVRPFVMAPYTVVREVKRALAGTGVVVGAQNMHWEDAGAWTGEISAPMLVDCSLDMVELGHSERREHFGETDERIGLKVAAALRHGLLPLICVGETRIERECGDTRAVLRRQVSAALGGIDVTTHGRPTVLFAYEPVWAIGEGGMAADPADVDRQHAWIKSVAAELLGGCSPAVLYGGSVNQANTAAFVGEPNVDGVFVGRAAWSPEGYVRILQGAEEALTCGRNRREKIT